MAYEVLGNLSESSTFFLEIDDKTDSSVLSALDSFLNAVEQVRSA